MQSMIFAAGLGTRLKPLTDRIPKALVRVGGKPLIEHVVKQLVAAGSQRVVVNVHHFANQIIEYLQDVLLHLLVTFQLFFGFHNKLLYPHSNSPEQILLNPDN